MATGDEDVKQLLTTLLRKELIQKPPIYSRGLDIDNHILKLDNFFKAICVGDNETKISILCTTLDDDVHAELCCQSDYSEDKNYQWICDRLKKLFIRKESDASPLIKLLEIKQKDGQSLRDYLSEIRVEGYKLMKRVDNNEREKQMVIAFVDGIKNQKAAVAVKALQPKNLDAAYNLFKKEEINYKSNECFTRKLSTQEGQNFYQDDKNKYEDEIRSLKNEMSLMRKQINSLLNILMTRTPTNNSQNNSWQTVKKSYLPNKQSQIRCYNCNEVGHLAKQCSRPIKCLNCGLNNHLTKFCRKENKNKFRYLADEVEIDNDDHLEKEVDQCSTTSKADFFTFTQKKMKYQKPVKHSNEPCEINQWANYIEGNGVRPKSTGMTVISKTHSEKAVNKPIVRGKLEQKVGKIFFDSGSELNLIDYNTAQTLAKNSPFAKFSDNNYRVTCANGSTMQSRGTVSLEVQLGDVISRQSFVMINDLFPRVFIGIRTMKDMNIQINPNEECISVNRKKIPFISGVQSIKHVESSENFFRSFL